MTAPVGRVAWLLHVLAALEIDPHEGHNTSSNTASDVLEDLESAAEPQPDQRFLLVEAGTGADRHSRHLTLHASPHDAWWYSTCNEYPGDWMPSLIVDLDTGEPWMVEVRGEARRSPESLADLLDLPWTLAARNPNDNGEALAILRTLALMSDDGNEEHHYAEAFAPLFERARVLLGLDGEPEGAR